MDTAHKEKLQKFGFEKEHIGYVNALKDDKKTRALVAVVDKLHAAGWAPENMNDLATATSAEEIRLVGKIIDVLHAAGYEPDAVMDAVEAEALPHLAKLATYTQTISADLAAKTAPQTGKPNGAAHSAIADKFANRGGIGGTNS